MKAFRMAYSLSFRLSVLFTLAHTNWGLYCVENLLSSSLPLSLQYFLMVTEAGSGRISTESDDDVLVPA